jgi:hypothetical protein
LSLRSPPEPKPAWTEDRHTPTVAVLNPTDVDQSLKLNITGAALSGKGTLWRLASAESNGKNPGISHSPVVSTPDSLALLRFRVSIYDAFGEV